MSESPINLHKIESEGSAFFKDVRLWRKKLAQNDGYGLCRRCQLGAPWATWLRGGPFQPGYPPSRAASCSTAFWCMNPVVGVFLPVIVTARSSRSRAFSRWSIGIQAQKAKRILEKDELLLRRQFERSLEMSESVLFVGFIEHDWP